MTLYQYIAKGVTYRAFESSRRYDEIISYNKNSAPLSLVRYGKNNTNQYTVIDALSYRYNGNQLVNVSDTCTHSLLYSNSFEFVNDNEGLSETEYTYDGNGNMKSDLNKGISSITYDKLNNPSRINYSDGKMIDYDYSADGRKLSTTYVSALSPLNPPIFPIFNSSENILEQPSLPSAHVSQDSMVSTASVVSRLSPLASTIMSHNAHNIRNISTTKYFGNYIFENGRLDKVLFDGGYVKIRPPGAWTYHYYFTDHLGSVRVVGDGGGDVEQVNHYYPYGGLIGNLSTNPDKQKYKYNGKEYDTMHGLNTYDYGARQYDGAKILWDRVDQLCAKKPWNNPYIFCGANPINRIDLDGMDDYQLNKDGTIALIKSTLDDFHLIYSVCEDGTVNENNRFIVNKHFFEKKLSTTVKGKGSDEFGGAIVEYHITVYKNADNSESENFFKFAVNNTDVEWSYIETSETSFIGTSNSEGDDASNSYIMDETYKKQTPVIKNIHSHSYGNSTPSPGDINVAKRYSNQPKNANSPQFYIYDRRDYHHFDMNSSPYIEFTIIGSNKSKNKK